tara:strand:- start:2052 stop:2351 length:300 start_codon:yes stop_codon:yes gene_type:complete
MSKKITFSEYYEYYLTLHQNKWNRRLHLLGQITTLSYIFICIYFSYYFMILLSPFVVYPFAWFGHFYFEKNKPAAFSRPLWAKICDLIMVKDMLLGKIK